MGMLDGLVPGNDPRLRRMFERRISGEERQASHEARNAALATARTDAASTAARARDAGISGGLAERLASRQQTAQTTAANQQFSQDRARERAAAEQGLAQMREQRGAFMRQLLGKGLAAGGALAGQLGVGGTEGGGGGPQGVTSAGGFMSGQGGGGLGTLGTVAGTAVGGPVGGMVGGQLGGMFGGAGPASDPVLAREMEANWAVAPGQTMAMVGRSPGMPQTMAMVDGAMAGFPGGPGAQPAPVSPLQQQVQAGLQTPGLAQAQQGGQFAPGFWQQLLRGF